MEQYYIDIAASVKGFPVYMYNIPQCAGNDIKTVVAQKVASACDNVIGIKYSFADMRRTLEYLSINNGDFSVMHGTDKLFASTMVLGCQGTVSGIGAIFPEPFVAAYAAFLAGNLKELMKQQKIIVKIGNALIEGANLGFFKEALKVRGMEAGHMRRPNQDVSVGEAEYIKNALTKICEETGLELTLKY